MSPTPPSERTRVRRLPERGHYDRATIDAILDAGFLCHVGYGGEHGPVVIPTAYGRAGDEVFFHGSAAGQLLRHGAGGGAVCLTVTHLDGLVLARSGFHSSLNYRSVMVFGAPRRIEEEPEKTRALAVISEHILPGRWAEIRGPSAQELKATLVLALRLDEVSAKVRAGGPHDDPEDYALPVWAGVVPVVSGYGEPVADAGITAPPPAYATRPRRP